MNIRLLSPAVRALIRKDLRLYFQDRRAVLLHFLAPLLIAGFFGYVFGGGGAKKAAPLEVAVVDLDRSPITQALVTALRDDARLAVVTLDEAAARNQVRAGKLKAALVIPPQFGATTGPALFAGKDRPVVTMLSDPSQSAAVAMLEGLLTQHAMQTITRELFAGAQGEQSLARTRQEIALSTTLPPGEKADLQALLDSAGRLNQRNRAQPATSAGTRGGMSLPYTLRNEAVTSGSGTEYNSFAHALAGMGVQFILFMGLEAGIAMLNERRSGFWKRFRAAPIGRIELIASRGLSASLISMAILVTLYVAGRILYGIHVEGSLIGLVGIMAAFSLMTAGMGLSIAALGGSPEATRGLAIFVILLLVMFGGAWVPSFVFPAWLQSATLVTPTRWVVDGLDAMTWRGLGFDAALPAIGVLLGFAAAFFGFAAWRLKLDE